MKFILDTHTWIWWHMNPDRLSEKAKAAIKDTGSYDELLLSTISTWEFCKLLEKGRIGISCDPLLWLQEALALPKLTIVPLSPLLAYRSTVLPQPFHDDPADQIIVASAIEEGATILTKDENILAYKYVDSLW